MYNQHILGICSWSFSALANPAVCARLAGLGIHAIQLDMQSKDFPLTVPSVRKDWLKFSTRYGIRLDSIMLNEIMTPDLTICHPASRLFPQRDKLNKILQDAILIAEDLHISAIIFPSFRSSWIHSEEDLSNTAYWLREAQLRCINRPIEIIFENVLSLTAFCKLRELTGNMALRWLLDPANFATQHSISLQSIWSTLCHNMIYPMIHIKDSRQNRPGICPLGTGDGRIAESLSVLRQYNFTGTLCLENLYDSPSDAWDRTDPWSRLERDIQWLGSHFQITP